MKHKFLLFGSPNSGKTTLFNWLTGFNTRVVNYPGSTVDYLKGHLLSKYQISGEDVVIDTPGIYSAFPQNSSEEITQKILFENSSSVCMVTLDALRIHRQLPLVLQFKEMGLRVVVALTMVDLFSEDFDKDKLQEELKVPVCPIRGNLGQGVSELVEELKNQVQKQETISFRKPGEWLVQKKKSFFERTDQIVENFFSKKNLKKEDRSQELDRFLLHPLFGLLSFFGIMGFLFSSIFWLAAPLMDGVDISFSWLAEKVLLLGNSLWVDFLANGVLTSFAAVFVFVPQIFILFAGICILEDTGYLSRTAGIVDALFSKVGLSGRSFIPFLSGYACAIPACLAARNITSRWERWVVIAVIPLLTCSARLPVYSLLLSLFFYGDAPWKPGLWMTLIYMGSIVLGLLASWVITQFLPKGSKSPLVMELPPYRKPLFLGVLSSAWRRTYHYIRGAGPLIFTFALIIWVTVSFPRNEQLNQAEQMEQSYAGRFGKTIEPVFEVMGGDWRVGVSLLTSFVAREVFVSTIATLFQITQDENEDSIQYSLIQKMRHAQNKRGDPLFTPLTVFILILFFMISLQCLSTTAVVRKETGSTLFAILQLVSLNVMAYVLCVGVYQILS